MRQRNETDPFYGFFFSLLNLFRQLLAKDFTINPSGSFVEEALD